MWCGHFVFLRSVPDCDDEYPDDVCEPSAACTDPSASSRTHEPHIGDHGEQDAVLPKKRSPVHPRTVHGQERPYKYVYCDDEYPDEVGEPSAACTDPSASSRTHEPHIGDYGEQDAVLLKKRSPVHPRTVHGQERPYKNHSGWFRSPPAFYKRKASVCHGLCCCSDVVDKKGGCARDMLACVWCEASVCLAGRNGLPMWCGHSVFLRPVPDCDDEYPDDVGEPSAACTDPSASSRTHEPHIGDHGEQDAVLPKKRSPVHLRTVHGQERPYKYCVPCWLKRTANVVRSWCVPEASNLEKRASADVHPVRVAGAALSRKMCSLNKSDAVLVHVTNVGTCTSANCDDEYPDDVGEPSAACTDPSASSRIHEPHIGDYGEQDAGLLKKRSPVHPRTVHGQERPYMHCVPCWLKRTANVVRSWCVPEASNLEKRASADVHPVRVAGAALSRKMCSLNKSDAVLVHVTNVGTSTSANCDDEYPDDVGEPSAACTDPSASSRIHEPHIGDYGEQDAGLLKKRSPVHPRTVHGQERPYKHVYCDDEYPDDVGEPSAACTDPSASSRIHEPHIGDYGEQDAGLLKKRSPVHPRTVHGQERPYMHVFGEPSTACTDPSASSITHEPHIGDHGEQDAVLPMKRLPVHPRTVHGLERPYKHVFGEPSTACTDPSASSITHEPHIGDHGEQDAVLPMKRLPVHPRTVHGLERPYKYLLRSWFVPEANRLEKWALADVHPVRVAGADPEDMFSEHIRRSPGSHCDDEYPDDVGEPSAACTDPSASSRSHEPHIGDYGEQDAVLLKKRSPVHPRTVHGQERPYKHVLGGFDPHPPSIKERPQSASGSVVARTLTRKVVGVEAAYSACTDSSASSRSHEPHIGDYGEQDAVLLKKRSPVHPRTVHGQERPYKHVSACTDSSASSRSHEPHIGDYGEQDAVLLKKRSPVHPRTVHGQERPYKHVLGGFDPHPPSIKERPQSATGSVVARTLTRKVVGVEAAYYCDDEYPDDVGEPSAACTDPSASSRTHEPHIGDYGEQDAVLLKKRSPVHPRTVHGQERPYKHVLGGFDPHPPSIKERPQSATGSVVARTLTRKVVGVEAAYSACTDSSASSRSHEPHIGDYGEQDAVLLKKRSPVHPRTVLGQERPYKHVYCDDEYPDDVGEPSAACTDPSASSRTHEPHIGDHDEQDAVLPKKRSPVHPRTVHGQERPYSMYCVPCWLKRTANVVRSWCVPEASNLEKRASADVHPVRVAGAVPEDVFFEHIRRSPGSHCDDEYPDEVGEPSAACTDPSASSRAHEPHIRDFGEQDAVLLKKRSPVHPRTVLGQERPYKYVSEIIVGGFDPHPPSIKERPQCATGSIAARTLTRKVVGVDAAYSSSRTHEPHIGDHGEQDAVLPKKRSPVHPRTVHGQERPYMYVYCYDEYPDEVGESSAACTDPSASSRAHEPHIRDFGEQDAVLLKKRSPVHPRTVLGQERPYKYVSEIIVGGFDPHPPSIKERPQCATGSIAARTLTRKVVGVDAAYFPDCDDEYPDDVGEPSAACTDPSASSRTHEPHIGDHGEQDAVLPKKSPVHPRTVLGQERPYKYCVPCWLKRTANVVRSWCVPEASNLEKRASADVHPVRVAGAVPEDVFFEHIRRSPGSRY
ncbi:unnamed protein product [Pieris macdunnoughi]|uniref:Uncharacterized protein n=1 Tax=Pieris macdunnoughi TaxID=345717 RepID=A0A821TA12_9NEOP|nr:unnamed protein product [Pieris macdunnoughi]